MSGERKIENMAGGPQVAPARIPAVPAAGQGGSPIITYLQSIFQPLLSRLVTKTIQPDDALINIAQTSVTIATSTKPQDPDVIANATAVPAQTGYDRIIIYNEVHRLSNKIWVINDGPDTLFAVATADAIKWSGESDILPGESRGFFNAYELRVRSPTATTKYRVTEYEPDPVLANRTAFTAQSIALPDALNHALNAALNATNAGATLPISVPNGFALVIRANVNNKGALYISASDATNAVLRVTLNAGDTTRLFITSSSLVFIALTAFGTDRVDILVEQ